MATEATTSDGCWLRLISYMQVQHDAASSLQSYPEQLAALLHGRLHIQSVAGSELPEVSWHYLRQYDLAILNEVEWLSLTRPCGKTTRSSTNQGQHSHLSVLLMREPRWPLKRLLLIIRGEATDRAAIEWGVRLAHRARCTVTLLVVMPPINGRQEQFITQALKASTVPGRHIRHALHQFAASQITGVLKLSYTAPERQVREEVTSSVYDLIILGSEPPGRLFSWRLESLLMPLLQWIQQSVLITGTTSPWSSDAVGKDGD